MRRIVLLLALLAALVAAGSASAAKRICGPQPCVDPNQYEVRIQLRQPNGAPSGAGATIHCQNQAGTRTDTVTSNSAGQGTCWLGPAGYWAFWGTLGSGSCYWGVPGQAGYAVWSYIPYQPNATYTQVDLYLNINC